MAMDDLGSRQLLVLFDPADTTIPSPAALIAAVNASARLPVSLLQPVAAQSLLDDSPADTAAEILVALSPRERLERYVVLTYANAAQADAARRSLAADKQVVSVQPNLAFGYSATPGDKFWGGTFLGAPATYQWGMRVLGMPKAWEKVRGYAYIAAIDSGVPESGGVIHPDLAQNFRDHLSRNFRDDGTASPYDLRDAFGHGSHVSGIMSATPEFGPYSNGQTNTGVAGACWTCSLVMLASGSDVRTNEIARALTFAADHGLQAVNMSFGDGFLAAADRFGSCVGASSYSAICTAIAHARDRDVVLVGASGNGNENRVQFPARSPDVIAVGGLGQSKAFWDLGYGLSPPCTAGVPGEECGSNYGPEQAVVAPALDVLSTIGMNLDNGTGSYNDQLRCGDKWPLGQAADDTYGTCTGTSMSAPHVTGLVGLLRSANPLLSRTQIRSLLTAHATPCTGNDPRCGAGVPNPVASVTAALGHASATNRLTPLFAFYSSGVTDHFYTTVPQMGVAALTPGGLWPQPPSPYNIASYDVIGVNIPNYLQFPTPECGFSPCLTYPRPKAIASIFTTHNNPLGGNDLTPLYRYSFSCRYASSSCAVPPATALSHVYATNASPMSSYLPGEHGYWTSVGYKLDGIEGYVFPKEFAQPAGTVKLCRKYDWDRDDYVLFPGNGPNGTDCSASSDGYAGGNYQNVAGSDWIGWVYPVGDARPVCPPALACTP